jgi:ankyrin repeat protein
MRLNPIIPHTIILDTDILIRFLSPRSNFPLIFAELFFRMSTVSLLPLQLSACTGDKEAFRSNLAKILVHINNPDEKRPASALSVLDQLDDTGLSLLHLLVNRGNADLTVALMGVGADVNVRDAKLKQTPLIFALARGQIFVAKAILENSSDKLDIHAFDLSGRTALHYAAAKVRERGTDQKKIRV